METKAKKLIQWEVTCLPTRMLQTLSSTSSSSLHRIDWDEANHMVDDTGTTLDDRNKANETQHNILSYAKISINVVLGKKTSSLALG